MTKICAFAFLCFSLISMSAFVQVKSDSTDSTDTTAPTTTTTTEATTQPSGVTLTTNSCNATQASLGTCYLICELDNFDSSDLVMYSADFYYYTTDPDNAVRITFHDGPNPVSILMTRDYYAGTYECRMSYRILSTDELKTAKQQFRIDPDHGSGAMGDSCNSRQHCATLNADCIDGECKCPDLYYIKFSKGDDNPACLAPLSESDFNGCNVDAECQNIDSRLKCANAGCIAHGSYTKMEPADVAYITLATIAVVLGICAIILSTIRKK